MIYTTHVHIPVAFDCLKHHTYPQEPPDLQYYNFHFECTDQTYTWNKHKLTFSSSSCTFARLWHFPLKQRLWFQSSIYNIIAAMETTLLSAKLASWRAILCSLYFFIVLFHINSIGSLELLYTSSTSSTIFMNTRILEEKYICSYCRCSCSLAIMRPLLFLNVCSCSYFCSPVLVKHRRDSLLPHNVFYINDRKCVLQSTDLRGSMW